MYNEIVALRNLDFHSLIIQSNKLHDFKIKISHDIMKIYNINNRYQSFKIMSISPVDTFEIIININDIKEIKKENEYYIIKMIDTTVLLYTYQN